MNPSAFGRAEFDYSDQTPAAARAFTSQGDKEWPSEARQYQTAAYSGMMVPVDPKIISLQAKALQAGIRYNTGVRTLVGNDDPGMFPPGPEGMMQDSFSGGGSTLEKYKPYIIGGSVLVFGLSLIYFMRS
jgi:hypothetical protein